MHCPENQICELHCLNDNNNEYVCDDVMLYYYGSLNQWKVNVTCNRPPCCSSIIYKQITTAPSVAPSYSPTNSTNSPSQFPSRAPTYPTFSPSASPSAHPTYSPSTSPSLFPSSAPTYSQSSTPS